jgi:heptosyltransferase-2
VTTQFGSIGVNNLVGKLSLLESVSLFDSADIVVSHDTGPLHMAGITRTAIIAIFGPTDPSVFLPQRTNVIAIWGGEGFACRPCYDGQTFAQCLHNGCMHQVTVTMVLQQVETIFIARQEGRLVMPHIVVPPNSAYVTLCNLS